MKIKLLSLCAALLAVAGLRAETLTLTTAVHTKPEETAPVIGLFKAGETVVPYIDATTPLPPGWIATEMPGPFAGYVQGKDLTKGQDLKPGAVIHLEPNLTSGVVAVAEKGDRSSLTGVLKGKWLQIKLEKKLIAYLRVGPAQAVAAATPAPVAPPPVPLAQVIPQNIGDNSASTLPRQFTGKFVSTRRPFAPRRPFDWALNDDAGVRYAYLDTSKLLITDPLEKFIDRTVIVFGAGRPSPDGRDIVIQIETLQIKP